ncbi:MAG: hypothetical protein HYR94_11465 [Chloroflexi bacterium]|nr:hypothetical protein [Chloroflexota bacterium]
MAELGPNTFYYLSPFLINHPTLHFLAPEIKDQRILTLPDPLPIRELPDHPVVLFIHPDDLWVFEQAQRIYPNANFEIASSQTDDVTPVVYLVDLQPLNLASVQGLQLRYYEPAADEAGDTPPEAPPFHTERALSVNVSWPADRPPAANSSGTIAPFDFVAEWSGVLYAPRYGPYSLRLITPGSGLLELDGNIIFDGEGEQLTGLPLAQGNHSIRVRAEGAPGQVALYWQPPGEGETLIPQWALYVPPIINHGLLGNYYPNDRWEGQPALQRIDPFLDIYFHFTPLPRPYTVEWTGSLDAPQSGLYRLGLRAVQEAQLYLDGQLLIPGLVPEKISLLPPEEQPHTSIFWVIFRWLASVLGLEFSEETKPVSPLPTETIVFNQPNDVTISLEAGLHDIRVRYKDNTDRSQIHLSWTLPTGVQEPIPSENLWPPLGRYPAREAPTVAATEVASLTLKGLATLGGPGNEPGQFFEPRDVAVLRDGNLVVADTVNRRVQILNPQGVPLKILTGDPFPFEEPLAVAVNSRDEILILDSTLQWVYRYDSAGNFLDRFGGPAALLFHPRGLAVVDDDSVVLADTGSSRLALFSADGAPAGTIGGPGSGPGQFNEPTDVLRDTQGTYYVAEAENNRIQRVDAGGNPLLQWAIPDSYGFNGRIYFDDVSSRLYITDVWTHQVHVFEVQTSGD